MMYVVKASDLREEAGECFVLRPAELQPSRPVVTPLDHRTRLKAVAKLFLSCIYVKTKVVGDNLILQILICHC